MLSAPSSPMIKGPTSQPDGDHALRLRALRVPLIHLLAVQPQRDSYLADTCRTSLANVRELLPKIAKASQDPDKWQLTDKSFRELTPYEFPYKAEDRERAINNAVKSFDRLRLAKDDELWQILLPEDERGQGKCLSRLNVKAPEHKPATPLHKIKLGTDKKPAASKKGDDKDSEKQTKRQKEVKVNAAEAKPKKVVREKGLVKAGKESATAPSRKLTNAPAALNKAAAQTSSTTPDRSSFTSTSTSTTNAPANKATAPSHRHTPSADTTDDMAPVIKQRKVMVSKTTGKVSSAPRPDPKMAPKSLAPQKDRASRPMKPTRPINTKPKNPSPLSASPPVNASDFEDNHPVHKALSGAPSPAKNCDRALKRKANDTDSDIHNHATVVKKAQVDRPVSVHTPASITGRGSTATPSSASSLKRKSDDSPASDTPISKIRKNNINSGLTSRYTDDSSSNNHASLDDSSSSTSPVRLNFRQSVELSQKFQQYYKKYEELYWKLAENPSPPSKEQYADLMKMHKKLGEMKQDIKNGEGVGR